MSRLPAVEISELIFIKSRPGIFTEGRAAILLCISVYDDVRFSFSFRAFLVPYELALDR